MTSLQDKICWIITDGSAGMENQCIGLAEALNIPFQVKRIKTNRPWKWLPPWAWIDPMGSLNVEGDLLHAPWPDMVISCGRQSIPLSIAVKKASGRKCYTIHIQTPNCNPDKFDLVIVPEHDRLRGANVLTSHGSLHRITDSMLIEGARAFESQLASLPRPLITALIGGSNRCYDVTPEVMQKLAKKLVNITKETGGGLAVTTSRRTGADNISTLKRELEGTRHIIWTGEEDNPYFGYLGLADYIVVTGDSVNMVCEACSSGKPVYVYELAGGNRKFREFHRKMFDGNFTRPLENKIEFYVPSPLNETQRIADLILPRFIEQL